MSQAITLLVDTMTSTAELVAKEVADTLEAVGFAPQIRLMDELNAGAFAGGGVFPLVCSTYGRITKPGRKPRGGST